MSIIGKFLKSDDEAAPIKATKSASKKSVTTTSVVDKSTAAVQPAGPRGLIIRPIVTEKSAMLRNFNQYVFAVKPEATKGAITMAVAAAYGVKPIAVRVVPVKGRVRRRGNQFGRTGSWKKAFVTLPEGKSITIQEGV